MNHLQSRSYWLGLDPYTPNAPLTGDLSVDVALLGGGFTSLWTAYLLLKERPDLEVAILEKSAVGYGASGRNGGFVMTLIHRSLAHLAGAVGDVEARKIHLAARQAVENVVKTVEAEGLDCDLQPNGLLVFSDSPPQDRLLQRDLETAQRLGLEGDFEYLDRSAAQERIHSERIRGGLHEEAGALVNPARLARELKRMVERLGARVFEGTAVESWEERPDGVRVRTAGGTLSAGHALLAANAYVTAWHATRDSVLPFYTYIGLTPPLSDAQWQAVGWNGREAAEDRRVSLHYFRPTVDGRILWGGRDPVFRPDGPKPTYDRDERVFRRLRESFEWFFPQLRDVPFEHTWGGPIAVTGSFMPCVGWLDRARRRVAFAYGYNGHGVAISNLAAHAVADLVCERESEWTDLAFVGPKPARLGPHWIRDAVVRATVRSQIRADDEGREAREPLWVRGLGRLSGARPKID